MSSMSLNKRGKARQVRKCLGNIFACYRDNKNNSGALFNRWSPKKGFQNITQPSSLTPKPTSVFTDQSVERWARAFGFRSRVCQFKCNSSIKSLKLESSNIFKKKLVWDNNQQLGLQVLLMFSPISILFPYYLLKCLRDVASALGSPTSKGPGSSDGISP